MGITTRASRKPAPAAVGSIAPMIVGTANFCVVTTFGADCGLTDLEGKLLIPSVQRTLERMPAAAAQKAAVVIDPLVILTVIIMWGKRIATTKEREAKQKYQIDPTEAARAAGVSGYSQSVPVSNAVANQQTNGTVSSPPNYDNAPSVVPPNATVNGYGAPEEIRKAIPSDAEF